MISNPKIVEIERIKKENDDIKTFFVRMDGKAEPGNYVMLWVPWSKGKSKSKRIAIEPSDQIPISISSFKKGKIGLSVKNVGETTKALHDFEAGDKIGITGPLGNSFDISGKKILIVAGSVGLAPLYFLGKVASEMGKQIYAIYGVKSKKELFLIKKLEKITEDIIITTEDGSYQKEGCVTDFLLDFYDSSKIDSIYSCGPEPMMKRVLDFSLKKNVFSQFSLDRYIRCGVGLCGFCAIDGCRVCKDGPVFTSEQLKGFGEFGMVKRSKSGRVLDL